MAYLQIAHLRPGCIRPIRTCANQPITDMSAIRDDFGPMNLSFHMWRAVSFGPFLVHGVFRTINGPLCLSGHFLLMVYFKPLTTRVSSGHFHPVVSFGPFKVCGTLGPIYSLLCLSAHQRYV